MPQAGPSFFAADPHLEARRLLEPEALGITKTLQRPPLLSPGRSNKNQTTCAARIWGKIDVKILRKFAVILVTCLCVSLWGSASTVKAAYEPDFDVQAEAVYMVNLDTGEVIYEKNAHEKIYPASVTKLMTAIVALENIPDLETEITAKSYIYDEFAGLNVSTGDIRVGQTLTAEQLMYAMMLQSANEAASILADYVGDGSIAHFAEMMNEKAKELGCENTNFVNPHGLFNENHYTTAYDLYLIADYARQIPGFMDYVTTPVYDVGQTPFHTYLRWITTNSMMMKSSTYYYEPIRGMKTGTLDESGKCFVSTATKDGYNYLLVVMGAPLKDADGNDYPSSVNKAFEVTKQLYEWAFDTFSIKTVLEEGKEVHDVPLKLCWGKDTLSLVSGSDFKALIPSNYDPSSVQGVAEVPNFVLAPIKKGDEVGRMKLMLSNQEIGTVPLIAAEDVQANALLSIWYTMQKIFNSLWFKYVVMFVVMLFVLAGAVRLIRRRNKQRTRKVRRTKTL